MKDVIGLELGWGNIRKYDEQKLFLINRYTMLEKSKGNCLLIQQEIPVCKGRDESNIQWSFVYREDHWTSET